MKPENQSYNLLGITRSKAKMYEFNVPNQYHLKLVNDPSKLLSLTIGIIGDYGKFNKKEQSEELLTEYKRSLVFAANFFDSFVESKLNPDYSDYFLLIGSSAFYLADQPGNAMVLADKVTENIIEFQGEGLETLLIFLLKNNIVNQISIHDSLFSPNIERIIDFLKTFYLNGYGRKKIIRELDSLCKFAYVEGNDRHLLLADIIRSVIKKQIYNSSWSSLKRYTDFDNDQLQETLQKENFIKEFWPAQKILGEKDIFRGKSAIIQMPTSAGKTKSLEIIIRSSFYSNRTNLAVIIAPFRALCSEIKNSLQSAFINEKISVNEPSDVLQSDFDFLDDFDFEESKLVLILTPEKFIYILRNNPELITEIGLLVYDEGHQFDNGIRGVTYELLLSSLKNKVSTETQIILISAVISNGEAIGDWLINGERKIVTSLGLLSTYRTIAFANWTTQLGMLQFVKNDNPDEIDFFVPRVIEQVHLSKKNREVKQRFFPEKKDGKTIALYLALKLVKNGSVAIFCGSKLAVKSISESVLDILERGYDVSSALINSDTEEVKKLSFLHSEHFGEDSKIFKSSSLGIFTHSSYTPEGLRLAIEYAMQKEKIKFVICTSTLAQGVNLPIRYLMITSFYQANSKLKTRDFHNLIGRAGRSGMHTEGSIIFTDTELFDNKSNLDNDWKWKQAKNLLDPTNSEPCGSTLLSIFDPLASDDLKHEINMDPIALVRAYIDSNQRVINLPYSITENHIANRFSIDGLRRQINSKIEIISSIESYLMAYWDEYNISSVMEYDGIDIITRETLAYSLSDENQKGQLIELFRLLAKNVTEKITTTEKRISFGKTLLGVQDILDVENWTKTNKDILIDSNSYDELLEKIWPILYQKSTNNIKKIVPNKFAFDLTLSWINGFKYSELLNTVKGAKTQYGKQLRLINQEFIIDICQNTYSYGITLFIAAICEVLNLEENELYDELIENLNTLQKMIKYGLHDQLAIAFYEIGFADRVIAIDLATNFDHFPTIKSDLIEQIKYEKDNIFHLLEKYPSYYEKVMNILIKN